MSAAISLVAAGVDDVPTDVDKCTEIMGVAGGSTPKPVGTPASAKETEACLSRPRAYGGQPP